MRLMYLLCSGHINKVAMVARMEVLLGFSNRDVHLPSAQSDSSVDQR
jgi:hypothetical protein